MGASCNGKRVAVLGSYGIIGTMAGATALRRLGVLVVAAALFTAAPAGSASAQPGDGTGGGCLPFIGCGSWDLGTGTGCINGLGCASGDLSTGSGCVDGVGCGSYRPGPPG
jgi:hypothetical protein